MKNFTRLALSAVFAVGMASSVSMAASQVYGYQMGDENYRFGFITFPSDNLDGLTVVQTASDDSYVGAGEYVDGKYYTFTVYYDAYFEGGVVTDKYCVWDVNDDGSKYTLKTEIDKYGTMRVTDMAFDYTTNTMYAIGESKKADSGKIGTTELYIVDLESGDLLLVGGPGDITAQDGYGRMVHENIIAIACSPDGQLYGMGEYRQLYKLDKFTGLATAVGERHRIAVDPDYQSMAFSPEGELYHAQKHPDYEYFMLIDTATGKLTNPVTGEEVTVDASFNNTGARFPKDPQVTGIYFKGFTVAATSPLAPSSLTATLRNGTSNTVDLKWTLPSENYGGAAANISNVLVYRFGTSAPIATLDATATTYTDAAAPDGDASYYVTAVSGSQYGFPALTTVMAGADQLKAVSNLKMEHAGDNVTLSWTAPTETVNGGYADFDNISYIVNLVSGTTVTTLTSDLTDTTYETTLTSAGTFSFQVIPVSCGIEGVAASTESVTIEKSSSIPYFSGFEDNEDGTLWTVINPIGGTYGWSIELPTYTYQRYDNKCAKFYTGGSETVPADTWLVSPTIYMEPGNYTLSYVACGGSFDTHTYEVAIGTDPTDAASFTSMLASFANEKVYNVEEGNVNNYQPYEFSFAIAEAGEYHIGFHGIGNTTFAALRIDNVAIDKAETPVTGLSLPYATSFEPEEETVWTYLNNDNAPNQGWSIQKAAGVAKAADGSYYAQFKTASNYPLEAWMISPALAFEAGTYELTFQVDGTSFDTQTFDIALGTDATDAASFTNVLKSYVDEKLYGGSDAPYVAQSVVFTVEQPGAYYIGFNGKGNASYATMKIDDLEVKAASESGLNTVVSEVADSEQPVYYDISGRRVVNPVRGNIYIVRKGNTVSKQVIR